MTNIETGFNSPILKERVSAFKKILEKPNLSSVSEGARGALMSVIEGRGTLELAKIYSQGDLSEANTLLNAEKFRDETSLSSETVEYMSGLLLDAVSNK